MERYTLIFMADVQSPVRRLQIPKVTAHRAVAAASVAVLAVSLGIWDYWRVRSENAELPALRAEATQQAERIRAFERSLAGLESEIGRVRELERKIRIIANLPGATATGGVEVTELAPAADGDERLLPPLGVPVDLGQGGPEAGENWRGQAEPSESDATDTSGIHRLEALEGQASSLRGAAAERAGQLDALLDSLKDKRNRLLSMPSIWPTRGWITSRFGPRISPFTGLRHLHAGLDVAARAGTPIVAPARGRVVYVGSKGPLGKSLSIDHGYGVRTVYGHAREITVKTGQQVERGQQIATLGNTGRSTGPHLHYAVQVRGKARNPLDYIFD